VQIMRWIVAIPDYAGTVTSPGGHHIYGFSGINDLRDLFTWLGAALLPLTLVYATSRAIVGHGDHVAIPITRVVVLGALLLSYPYWWSQAAALINEMTDLVLSLPLVSNGLHKLMLYAVEGAALGGWQLIDLVLMGATGVMLLALIFLKVVIILLGGLLYATGPITIGLVPTDAGAAISRAWLSAVGMLLLLPVAWAVVFAVGALLINDAGTAGPLISGSSDIGSLLGGVLLAAAGLASLWVCLRVAREAGSLMRIQLGGMLALSSAGGSHHAARSTAAASSGGQSVRTFTSRVSQAASAAGSTLAQAGPGGALAARGGGLIAGVGRRGLLGSAGAGTRAGAQAAAPGAAALIGRSRAGAIAAQMARAGTASWQTTGAANTPAGFQSHRSAHVTTTASPTSDSAGHGGKRSSSPGAPAGSRPPAPGATPGVPTTPADRPPPGSGPTVTRPGAAPNPQPHRGPAPSSQAAREPAPSTLPNRSSTSPPPAPSQPLAPPRPAPSPRVRPSRKKG
jgi:hypothetical protein